MQSGGSSSKFVQSHCLTFFESFVCQISPNVRSSRYQFLLLNVLISTAFWLVPMSWAMILYEGVVTPHPVAAAEAWLNEGDISENDAMQQLSFERFAQGI